MGRTTHYVGDSCPDGHRNEPTTPREWNATYKNRIADLEAKLDQVRVDRDALRALVFKYAHDLNFTFDERERIFMECTNYEFDNGGGSSDIVYSTAQRKNFRRLREALVRAALDGEGKKA